MNDLEYFFCISMKICVVATLGGPHQGTSNKYPQLMFHGEIRKMSGPGCSKLTTSLVNDSLKFTSSDTQVH